MLSKLCNWRVRELGLGRGIDSTLPNPWATKLSFQVREPKIDKNWQKAAEGDEVMDHSKSNVICTDEGGTLTSYVNEVTSTRELQGKLDLSVTLPNTPVTVDVGIDMSRSLTRTQVTIGKRIHTKTIAFKANLDKDTDSEDKLDKYILEGDANIAELSSDQRLSLCYKFVKHYHATHYVSSITLGASRFIMTSESDYIEKVSAKGKAGYQSIAQAGASASFVNKLLKKHEEKHCVGKMNEKRDTVETEAVVEVAFEPISHLVTKELREPLEKALRMYIREQKEKQG